MTFKRHLLDSNILIDYLNGIQAAAELINDLPGPILISIITRMELLAGARNSDEEQQIIALLDHFETVQLEHDVMMAATRVRRYGAGLGKKPKLPDAIIYASAMERGAILYTRNSKDFPAGETVVHPYVVPAPAPEGAEAGKVTLTKVEIDGQTMALFRSPLSAAQMAGLSTEEIAKRSAPPQPPEG